MQLSQKKLSLNSDDVRDSDSWWILQDLSLKDMEMGVIGRVDKGINSLRWRARCEYTVQGHGKVEGEGERKVLRSKFFIIPEDYPAFICCEIHRSFTVVVIDTALVPVQHLNNNREIFKGLFPHPKLINV